jgi:tRNA-specific 2-thiouridylase
MSGGVDSSVTALLLNKAGWQVLGITMKIPVVQSCLHPRPCCGAEAAFVCREIGVPHYYLDVVHAFEQQIIAPFRESYLGGLTPNPCVDCNTLLKFGLVWAFLEETFGIRHLATGHYARVVTRNGRSHLARAADTSKDQSYFLYGLSRSRLPRLVLPLGERNKKDVRELARNAGLPVAEQRDSMELCFVGEGNYRHALDGGEPTRSGPILDTAGNILAEHDGVFNYTVGQRRGLHVAGGKPLYVVRLRPKDNFVIVGTREEASRRDVRAEGLNVLTPEGLSPGDRLCGKIRSYGQPAACEVVNVNAESIAVRFDSPQFGPSPGQHLVLYDDDDNVVAGGRICAES